VEEENNEFVRVYGIEATNNKWPSMMRTCMIEGGGGWGYYLGVSW
jgi:hypothetical protein